MLQINPHMFRANDIRGTVNDDLTPEVAEILGKSFGSFIRKHSGKTVLIGRDNRLSSTSYAESFTKGLVSTGCSVFDAGLVTTPMVYFGLRFFNLDAAVMVTGSHNPPTMNGFKLCNKEGAIAGSAIQTLYQIIMDEDFISGKGSSVAKEIKEHYTNFMLDQFSFKHEWKIVVDGGNSIGGYGNLPILTQLGLKVLPLYCELDGTFPHHFPDPTVIDNVRDMIGHVTGRGYAMGVAYDGDGDRLGVVDNAGTIRWGDQLMILFSRDILKKYPGAKILCEVKCSQALIEDILANGGIPVMCPTGHSIVEEKLKEENALLAGEMSGHLFFRDRYFGYDDALYATLRLLEIMDKNPSLTLNELFSTLPEYHVSPEIRIPCVDEEKFTVVERIKEAFKDEGYEMIEVDGARVIFEGGWGLIRASQTEGKLIIRFEGKTKEWLYSIRDVFEKKLKAEGKDLPSW